MHLGKQIAHYRKSKNITQEALAKLLGISNQAVSKWETEQSCPDVELLPRIADIFDITLDELFGRQSPVQVPITEPSFVTAEAEAQTAQNPSFSIETFVNEALSNQPSPWKDDNTLRVVLFQGQRLIQTDELKERFGKISKNVSFHYCGPALNIESCLSVCCEAVSGSVTAGSYVECEDVGQSVTAGGYVECGDVGQYVIAGGYVECGDVGQNVTAGGYAECGDVGGNVSAGGYAECEDVAQNVAAGSNVNCGDVKGDVSAEGDIDCGDVEGDVSAGGNVDCGDVAGSVNTNRPDAWHK
ncbi:MAG: helix-turn-helix domain-containing protein [Lachnospiraceae bacterium]|nr:helix-turn-helix domain-containing protein [Lachnospiraceae bacterium]